MWATTGGRRRFPLDDADLAAPTGNWMFGPNHNGLPTDIRSARPIIRVRIPMGRREPGRA